jgi:hypothetical protein
MLEGVLYGESNVEVGCESDLWSDRQSDSVSDSSTNCDNFFYTFINL